MATLLSRRWGALIIGLALAAPLGALAQQNVPATAPTKGADVKHEAAPQVAAPKAESPPAQGQASTATPGWNNPPADWNAVSEKPQYASIPGPETNVLIQAEGRKWRALRDGVLTQAAGWLIVIVLAALLAFYLVKGPIKLHNPPTGRLIERFNSVERAAHWTTAICFVVLAITALIMFFGKYLLLPWTGYVAFSWITIISKNLHNFVGPLFIFSIIVTFLLFVRDNFFGEEDWKWFARIGGAMSGHEYPSGRFNGLEKVWFWGGLTLLGVIMAVTGVILDFPNWNQTRGAMQLSEQVHLIAAVLFIMGGLGHIYIGTIGMRGAYRGMREGYVDEEWAREHHLLWYEQVKAGQRPEKFVAGRAQPAPGDD